MSFETKLPLNQIICGDCVDVMETFPKDSIDLIVTSPPYDSLRAYHGYDFDYKLVADQLYRVIKVGGVVVWVVGDATVNGSETGTSFKHALYFKAIGFNLHDTMIYRKMKYVPLTHNRYEQEFEYMFVFSKGKPKTFNPIMIDCKFAGNTGKAKGATFYHTNTQDRPTPGHKITAVKDKKIKGNVWDIPPITLGVRDGIKGHPGMFPESLAQDHIISWSNEGDLILDPMNGSGTTCVSAKLLNRDYIGIDVSEEYCNLSRDMIRKSQDGIF